MLSFPMKPILQGYYVNVPCARVVFTSLQCQYTILPSTRENEPTRDCKTTEGNMEQNKFITQACTHISSYYVSQHQKELSNANAFIHNANVNTAGR